MSVIPAAGRNSPLGGERGGGGGGGGGRGARAAPDGARKPVDVRAVWPMVMQLVAPRRKLLAIGLVLMAINRVTGLVLPGSTKWLIDDVVGKRHVSLLLPLVGIVLAATIAQGITSYSLTQLLSKEAQRLIAEMRRQVQAHISRLPVMFYDQNKTGALVSRIMSDVEGVRNLIGTGLVEFVGGLLTAVLSLIVLLRINATMTLLTASVLIGFMLVLSRAFSVMRPIFRERGKLQAEVTGRLTESLGAVRVVKGYHAEKREQGVFAAGVGRLLENVLRTLTAQSVMSLSSSVLLGVVGAVIMFFGARHILDGTLTLGEYFTYTMFLGFLIAPMVQIVAIGTQLTEALAGLERTREVLAESPEDEDPRRVQAIGTLRGDLVFDHVDFAYEAEKPVLHDVSFTAPAGTVTALVGSSGSGKSTIIGLIAAFHSPGAGRITVDGVDLSTVRLDAFRPQLGVVLQDTFLFAGTIRENVAFSRPDASDERSPRSLPRGPRRRVRRSLSRGTRHHRGRARRETVRRPASARGDRARDPGRPPHPDPRRGHVEPGLGVRVVHPGRAPAPDAGPYHVRDRPPPEHDPPRRPDPGGRRRPHRGARHARIALRREWPLPRSVRSPARAPAEPVPGPRRRRHDPRG